VAEDLAPTKPVVVPDDAGVRCGHRIVLYADAAEPVAMGALAPNTPFFVAERGTRWTKIGLFQPWLEGKVVALTSDVSCEPAQR
jgi:hypothetical protein